MMVGIVPAEWRHAAIIGACMRSEDAAEGRNLGFDPFFGAIGSFHGSVWSRAALVDGEVAAVWGVTGSLLSGVGRPWLLTAEPCKRVSPLRFARIYRTQACHMLGFFPKLENYVDAGYCAAVRMLAVAGFSLDEPKPLGPHGILFRRFEMVAR